ncbi:MAG: helix-turn-helix transcriptional regulator [bacterium]|nr:helix-turn-helix transcriptional regulator [bacterium]
MKKYRTWSEVKAELLADPERKQAYDRLEPYYQVLSALISLRNRHNLTQKKLADLLGVNQSEIARLESFDYNPSVKTLNKIAEATGTKLEIAFVD